MSCVDNSRLNPGEYSICLDSPFSGSQYVGSTFFVRAQLGDYFYGPTEDIAKLSSRAERMSATNDLCKEIADKLNAKFNGYHMHDIEKIKAGDYYYVRAITSSRGINKSAILIRIPIQITDESLFLYM